MKTTRNHQSDHQTTSQNKRRTMYAVRQTLFHLWDGIGRGRCGTSLIHFCNKKSLDFITLLSTRLCSSHFFLQLNNFVCGEFQIEKSIDIQPYIFSFSISRWNHYFTNAFDAMEMRQFTISSGFFICRYWTVI